MTDTKIITEGPNPRIAGTRISIFTIWEHVQEGWRPEDIAFWLRLDGDQIRAALDYIAEHEEEVRAGYAAIMERVHRGNPPEIQEKLERAHERLQVMLHRRRGPNGREGADEGHPGRQ